MNAISSFPYFSSSNTSALRASDTGTGPSQGGVLSHYTANRKQNTIYYGVQSAVFTPATEKQSVSGSYQTSRQVCITTPTVTTTVYGQSPKNSNTGSIKTYGNSVAAYTNRPWETSVGSSSSVIYSSSVKTAATTVSKTVYSTCVTCR